MKTIGFTEVYYTLWEVGEIQSVKQFYQGMVIGVRYEQSVIYCQNLSIDLEKAKAKLEGEPYEIDLELRGHSSFTRCTGSDIKDRENYYLHDELSFGKMEGMKIINVTDVWQLKRGLEEERSKRRRARIRRRLIELGELVRYPHFTKRFVSEDSDDMYDVRNNYATPGEVAKLKEIENSGHFFTDGAKVTLELKEIRHFGFQGAYGWTSIRVYETKEGQIVKYVGSSPIQFENGDFYKVSATIKHSSYNGINETKLLRMKFVK